MSFTDKIKSRNQKVSKKFVGSRKYWMRSPSNYLLDKETQNALKKYSQGGKVLDAGAGKMPYRKRLEENFDEYVSSDFTKTHDDIDVVTDIEDMPFADQEFDFVFTTQVLEHVPHPWIALKEINRILKPGGRVLVTVPMFGYIHNAPHDFFRYTRFGLRSMAKDAGYDVLELKPMGGFFTYLGYVRSTILTPLYGIPLLGTLILYLNYIAGRIEIAIDKIIPKEEEIFALNNLLILEKNGKQRQDS